MNLSLLGERIKYTRTKQGLTLEKLSEKVGISRNFLWEIEDGRKAPAITTFYNICSELSVSADYLFGFSPVYSEIDNTDKENVVLSICNIVNSFEPKEINMLYELLETYNRCK